MTLLSLSLHVHEISLDYNIYIFTGCSMILHGMYILNDDHILLLALPLFQISALCLHLEHSEPFPQALWGYMIGHQQPQFLTTVLRGLQLVDSGPQGH